MIDASPGPDATVGGTVDFVDLAFLEPVTNAVVILSFNGEPISGQTTVRDGKIIRFELDQPLSTPGRYQVEYELISFDTDYTTDAFFFTYSADGAQPVRIETAVSQAEGGSSRAILGATVGLLTVVIGLLAVFVWRLDAKRHQGDADAEYEADPEHDGDVEHLADIEYDAEPRPDPEYDASDW
jgi:methionine-rich copper-binding protein CopC